MYYFIPTIRNKHNSKDIYKDLIASETLRETKASLLGLSTLMTTTMPEMASVVEAVKAAEDLRDVTVLIGGAPTSGGFAGEIGADEDCGHPPPPGSP